VGTSPTSSGFSNTADPDYFLHVIRLIGTGEPALLEFSEHSRCLDTPGRVEDRNRGSGYRFDSFRVDPPPSASTPTMQPIKVVPGESGTPHWLKTEGKSDDVNGNFRLDVADETLSFHQMAWIGANEPLAPFDHNGNGRIDVADIAWLFTTLSPLFPRSERSFTFTAKGSMRVSPGALFST
jgi:PKD repeat protein